MNISEYTRLKLISLRKSKNLTRSQLGKLIGRNEKYIAGVEAGMYELRILNLLKFCDVLDTDPCLFFHGWKS